MVFQVLTDFSMALLLIDFNDFDFFVVDFVLLVIELYSLFSA